MPNTSNIRRATRPSSLVDRLAGPVVRWSPARVRMLAAALVVATVATLTSTATPAAPARKKVPVAAIAPTPPAMRLGDAVKPLAYDVELTLVPTRERFSGRVAIHVDVAQPTELVWLNATRLDVRSASVAAGGRTFDAKPVAGGRDHLGLQFASALPAGRAVITIEYDGVVDRTETAGIFAQQDGGQWYAFTQFENTDARRAFPCFDEPGWKVPWYLTLIVPAEDFTASNMPIASEEPYVAPVVPVAASEHEAPGAHRTTAAPKPATKVVAAKVVAAQPAIAMKRVRFAPTPPLPSYLVAFVVGPFDVVDAGRAGRKGTPLRFIVPKGRGGEVAYAKETVPKLLDLLEDYFGMPYPYPKLDAVAIPLTVGFGAMENVGLITYEQSELLSRPDQENERFRRRMAGTAAHEMAHQWFGDYVTLDWWNDTWLNESFATWMGAKVVDRFAPTWQEKLLGDERRFDAIQIDRLSTTRQIRQPVNTPDDLGNAFDAISYQKGAAVLSMVETSVGEERFRNGIRRYMDQHANANAKAEDFFEAVASEAGTDSGTLVAEMRSFVEQPGVPRVAVSLDCGADGNAPPKLVVAQSRFLPAKSLADAAVAQRWTVPACFQFGRGGDFNEVCSTLQEPRTVVALPSGERCPQWVLPNRGGSGYFVSSMPLELTQQLTRTPLLPSEAVPALHDATTLAESGEWPIDLALDFAARFANNRQPIVSNAAVKLARVVKSSWLDDAGDREAFARYVQKNFGARAKALGWLPKSGDRDGDAVQRAQLVPWVADRGADPGLQREAQRLAREWLAGRAPFPAGADSVLQTVARLAQGQSGRDYLDALTDAVGRVGVQDRRAIVDALGSFRDPALAEASYEFLFSDRSDPRNGFNAIRAGAATDEGAATQALGFLKTHVDAVTRRLPDYAMAWFPKLGDALCDAAAKGDLETTFADRAARAEGGARNYAQAVETLTICIGARQTQHATLKAYLAKQ